MRHFSLIPSLLTLWVFTLAGQNSPLVYPFAYQGQWGIVQEDRTLVLSPQLDSIGFFLSSSEHNYALAFDDGKCGIVKANGEWLAKPKFDSIGRMQYYAKNLHWAEGKGKLGLLKTNGKKGKWLVKPKFSEVTDFNGKKVAVAAVAIEGRWGVINNEGKLIASCKYDKVTIMDSYSDYPDYKLSLNGKNDYIDAFGEPLSEERIKRLEEEFEMWGDDVVFEDTSIDADGRIPQLRLDEQANPAGGTDVVLTQDGVKIQSVNVPAAYQIVGKKIDKGYSHQNIGYIQIKQNGKYGFWSKDGHLATPVKYDQITWQRSMRYGQLAFLHKAENVGLADAQGNLIFTANFTSISEFSYYFKLVHAEGYIGYGTSKGQVFLPENVILAD